ncbi:MAG: calcium/sodium antiporter [Planctomycetia bacterium]|nr:calcium/sodium antiporter [Planctomycetia bacterium]
MEALIILAKIFLGGGILIAGGELLVRGASRIALMLRVPSLIVGLTIVAICTSAPELTVSLLSCFKENGSPELAVGNVIGSNTFNILGILGIAALFCPIVVSSKLIHREIPLMIFLSGLFWLFAFLSVKTEGLHFIPRWGGVVFIGMMIGYMTWTVVEIRRKENNNIVKDIESESEKIPQGTKECFCSVIIFFVGLAMLIFGSDLFINGAVLAAEMMGVSKLVIGLTILAVGTSLPEIVVSVLAVMRGKSDLAIGNVLGSNMFNIFGVLGLTALLTPGGLNVSRQALVLDIPMMFFVACFGSLLCITDRRLTRGEGIILISAYLVYLVYLICVS